MSAHIAQSYCAANEMHSLGLGSSVETGSVSSFHNHTGAPDQAASVLERRSGCARSRSPANGVIRSSSCNRATSSADSSASRYVASWLLIELSWLLRIRRLLRQRSVSIVQRDVPMRGCPRAHREKTLRIVATHCDVRICPPCAT